MILYSDEKYLKHYREINKIVLLVSASNDLTPIAKKEKKNTQMTRIARGQMTFWNSNDMEPILSFRRIFIPKMVYEQSTSINNLIQKSRLKYSRLINSLRFRDGTATAKFLPWSSQQRSKLHGVHSGRDAGALALQELRAHAARTCCGRSGLPLHHR